MFNSSDGTAGAVPFIPVILAGGSGERFWPLSRRARPKQFLALDGTDRSLIQATADRLAPLAGGMDNLLIVAGHAHRSLILEHLPDLPIENLVVEPVGRDTAPAVLLAAITIARRYSTNCIMGVFPSDHRIGNPIAFQDVVNSGIQAVTTRGGILTIGIRPSYPATGYGYLEAGESLDSVLGHEVRRVVRFVEKPTLEVAENFLATGRYFWNAGMFIFKAGEIIEEFRAHAPELLATLEGVIGGPRSGLVTAFENLKKISFDYAIMEKTARALVMPADFEWDDLGDWNAIERLLKNTNPNVAVGRHLGLDTAGAILYTTTGDDLIATIGLEDVLIVRDGNVTLVVRKDRTQDIKKIVERLKASPDFERYA